MARGLSWQSFRSEGAGHGARPARVCGPVDSCGRLSVDDSRCARVTISVVGARFSCARRSARRCAPRIRPDRTCILRTHHNGRCTLSVANGSVQIERASSAPMATDDARSAAQAADGSGSTASRQRPPTPLRPRSDAPKGAHRPASTAALTRASPPAAPTPGDRPLRRTANAPLVGRSLHRSPDRTGIPDSPPGYQALASEGKDAQGRPQGRPCCF